MDKKNLSKIILFIFFLSGFASLVYEIIWSRMLIYIFGNTTYSISIVIGVFMAGLSAGSLIFGKIADRSKNLLLLYALVELLVGFFGFLSPFLIQASKVIFLYFTDILLEKNSWEILIKSAISFAILFPPTFFMGATLPILIRLFNTLYGQLSKQTGRLYAINTLGAVFGVLITGFIFIELFGLQTTIYIAVFLNLLIAVISFNLSRRLPEKLLKQTRVKESINNTISVKYSKRKIIFLIAIYTMSGFIALSYEVLWTRLITPASGIYIYGFSIMLAMFLLGIAIGSFIYEKFLSQKVNPFLFVGLLQLSLSIFAVLIVVFVSFFMPIWTKYIYRLSVPIIVFIPPTIAMGLMFPAISEVFSRVENVAEKIGMIYAFNSFGSIAGSLVSGFILIPVFGTVESVMILAIVNALLGYFLIVSTFHVKKILFLSLSLVLIVLNIFVLYNSRGIFLPRLYKVHLKDFLKRNQTAIFTIKEDAVASILAIGGGEKNKGKRLYIDGIATTSLVEETKMFAHLPILLHPNPEDVLIIAMGMGTTFRSALSYPETSVEVVELVPSVPALLGFFHNDGESVLKNPRGKVIVNDGRNYVFLSDKKYDIVTIDPPPPTNGAGTTVLFSDEFYKDIKRKLKEGGIVQAWIHFDLDKESIMMMSKTFEINFPYIQIFLSRRGQGIYLLGSEKPIVINKERVDKMLAIPSVYDDMTEWLPYPYTVEFLQSMYAGDKESLTKFTKDSVTITDYFPRTEFSLIRSSLKHLPVMKAEDFISEIK